MIYWIFCFFFLGLAFDASALQVSGLTYLNTVRPGEKVNFTVTLISDKDQPELVEFKLCDYSCNSDGQHFFEDIGTQQRSNARWITLGSHHETINPGERRDVYVTIDVPKDLNLKGSYWSILLIEPTVPLQTLTEAEHGFRLHVKVRYAYHIVTNVGVGNPSLKITKKGIDFVGGKKHFVVDVNNTGDLFLNPKMTLKLFSKQGKLEKTQETQPERLYPGSSSRYLVDGNELKAGDYTAFLLLDNSDGKIFGDTFGVTIP